MGAEAIQVHPTPPGFWGSPKLDDSRIATFKEAAAKHGRPPFYFHAVYLINLAGDDPTMRQRSESTLAGYLKAADELGVDGVIFHSDRGSEYTADAFQTACRRLGVVQSMGRVGSALDNAAAEAFNSTIKVEYIHRHRFRTRAEARLKIATWIVDFYNARRRHSACDGLSPIDYERFMAEARRTQAA